MNCLVTKKTKAKEWFTIIAPKIFDEREIGRTMTSDPKSMIGRKLILSMMELTDSFDKFYMKISFRIIKIEGNKAYTIFDGSECLRDYISRMVLRRSRRIDTIQDLKTKDGLTMRVKCLAIISKRIKSNIQLKIRNQIKEKIKKEVESLTLEEFVNKIISDEIKKKILREERRIYPVRNFEIRKTEMSTQAKTE